MLGQYPVFEVDTGVTSIKRGDIVYISADGKIKPVQSTARDKVLGIAAEEYPKVTGGSSSILYGSEASNQGPETYTSTRNKIAVVTHGTVWVNVKIPAGSATDITIVAGDQIVPVLEAGTIGGAAKYTRTDLNVTFSDTEVEAALDERDRIIGKAIAAIHAGLVKNDILVEEDASLGQNILTSGILTAGASAVFGKVPVQLTL